MNAEIRPCGGWWEPFDLDSLIRSDDERQVWIRRNFNRLMFQRTYEDATFHRLRTRLAWLACLRRLGLLVEAHG